jgi:fluoride exporter
MARVITFLIVCGGGALGSGVRYLVALWATARGWTAFPWGTLIVNVVGCFFIMLITTIAASRTMSTDLRLFLTTGIMGGLTTYSTFDFETSRYLTDGRGGMAALYVGVTLVVCLAAGMLGRAIAPS